MKWEGLTQKKGSTDPEKGKDWLPTLKNRKDWLEKWEGMIGKVWSSVSKNGKVWAKTRK